MASNIPPETDSHRPVDSEKGEIRRILLLSLVLLGGVAVYLYFFTGLIKNREESAKPATGETTPVKKPIPPRPEAPVAKVPVTAKAEEKPAGEQPGTPATAPLPTRAQPSPQPAPPPAPAKPNAARAAKAASPSATVPATPAASPVKKGTTVAAVSDTAVKKEASPAAETGRYAVQVDGLIGASSVKRAQAKLHRAGIRPVKRSVEKKSEPMTRLMLGEFGDRAAAAAELVRLKKVTGDGFMLPANGSFAVYAGSYYMEGKAVSEQKRLQGKGITTVMKKAQVSIPVVRLTAGSFSGKDGAHKAAALLGKQGLSARVVTFGK